TPARRPRRWRPRSGRTRRRSRRLHPSRAPSGLSAFAFPPRPAGGPLSQFESQITRVFVAYLTVIGAPVRTFRTRPRSRELRGHVVQRVVRLVADENEDDHHGHGDGGDDEPVLDRRGAFLVAP